VTKKKAPAGCYWRGNTLWGQCQVKRQQFRYTLRTDDPVIAAKRQKAFKDAKIAELHFGEGNAKAPLI
jgi:integrase/recombinase XerD